MKQILKRLLSILKSFQLPLNWLTLYNFSTSKFVVQTYFFVVAIPIVATVFNNIDELINFSIGSFSVKIPVLMPLSWAFLFTATLLLLLLRLVVILFMPEIIKYQGSIKLYSESGLGYYGLLNYVNKYEKIFLLDENKDLKQKITSSQYDSEKYYNDFFLMHKIFDKYNSIVRWVATILLISSCGILFSLIINNSIKVYSSII